ncbi:dual specificity protein phosphatase 8-like [Lissotriton helveticus]
MGGDRKPPRAIGAHQLAGILRQDSESILVIDCRTSGEYNNLHVTGSVNLCGSRLARKRLVKELLLLPMNPKVDLSCERPVVVYDQDTQHLEAGQLLSLVLGKLEKKYSSVSLLEGGFAGFSSQFPGLCEGRTSILQNSSISQPCLSTSAVSITRVLPHLYLGSQSDALDQEVITRNGITHLLNISCSCPKPNFVPDSHFLRIPINDSYSDKILPWLQPATEFIDKAELVNGKVLVHCLAGISRSAAIAIAYVMSTMGLPLDDAYRFVKEKRPNISPNFNFLGQLLEHEMSLASCPSQHPPRPSHTDRMVDRRRSTHCCAQEPCTAQNQPCPGTCSAIQDSLLDVEVALDAGELEGQAEETTQKVESNTTDLESRFTTLDIASEPCWDSGTMKRSFSLDIKSVYSPTPSTPVLRLTNPLLPVGSQPAQAPAHPPKPLKIWNRIFGFGFNFLYFFSEDEEAKDKLAQESSSGGINDEPKSPKSPSGLGVGRHYREECPQQPFTLSRPGCRGKGLSQENGNFVQSRAISPVPV